MIIHNAVLQCFKQRNRFEEVSGKSFLENCETLCKEPFIFFFLMNETTNPLEMVY